MNWQEICADPSLNDLPCKIETNAWGQIVMTPINNRRGLFADSLHGKPGQVLPNCPIDTREGIKVVDVAWATSEFITENVNRLTCATAPTLCIDVAMPGIDQTYYLEKRELYFARSVQEVWLCNEHGALTFYDCTGQIPASRLFPDINRIESDYLH
jgi:hypothetical protein